MKFKINIVIEIKILNRKQTFRDCRNMKNIRQSERTMRCIYFYMTDMRYGKSITITNMQIIITKIWFWSSQGCKVRCNVLICIGVQKPISSTCWWEIMQRQICTRLLSIAQVLELKVVRICMAECLTQLVAWILPPTALPITLSAITGEGAVEAAEIWSRRCRSVASITELVGMPNYMETTLFRPKFPKEWCWETK